MIITQSSSAKAIPFYMVDSTDHIAPKTGLTPTVTISKNGGTFAAPSGAISEVANGWYKIAGNATDSNTVGALLVHATATGADPYDIEHEVVVFNVDSATVTVGTNNDKTGYTLTAAYDSAKTAASQANVATELTNYGALKPTTAGRTLDVTATGEAGLDFDNTVGTLAKGTDITGFNDLSAANVQTELTTYGALKPTTAGRTLDVSTGGEAGLDWANIGAPTTTVGLTGTTISTTQTITSVSGSVGSVTGAVGSVTGAVGSVTAGVTLSTAERNATADQVWDEVLSGHLTAGTTGAALNGAGSAGDPWGTALPGAYGAGTAGNIVGNRLDAAVTTRLAPTTAGRTLDVATTGEAGLDFNNVAGTIPDSAGVTTLLTRITSTIFSGITSMKEWLGMLAGKQVGNTTARTELRSSGAGAGTFDETTDSQEAIRDRGDAAWITGAGGDPWATALPGAYGAGTAGNIIGGNLNATVSSRATPAQVQTELGTYGALKPTTAGRTLDITVTGEAGVDFDNTVGTLAKGTDITGFNDIPAGTAMTLTSAYDAAKTAAQPGAAMTLTSAYDSAKTASSQASNDQIYAAIDTEVGAIKAKTDQLVFTTPGKVDASATVVLSAGDMNSIADAILKRDWTLLTGEAAYSLLNAARMLRNQWNTTGGTLTVKKEDGSTTAWTRTLATDPTAQPIVGAT
jgi:hypothetical protein